MLWIMKLCSWNIFAPSWQGEENYLLQFSCRTERQRTIPLRCDNACSECSVRTELFPWIPNTLASTIARPKSPGFLFLWHAQSTSIPFQSATDFEWIENENRRGVQEIYLGWTFSGHLQLLDTAPHVGVWRWWTFRASEVTFLFSK